MLNVRSPQQLSEASVGFRNSGRSIALVPTMGALHNGHLSLFKIAQLEADVVVVSIFVNPLQFNSSADFEKYPLQMEQDAQLLESQKIDVLYAPDVATMYGPQFSTSVQVDGITNVLEGASRPGHFSGVATVVTKLFSACQAHVAIFGQKDFQQFAVIQRIVADLDMPIRLIMAPTVREVDGLAMSSRNTRLSATARHEAAALSQGLSAAQSLFNSGVRESQHLIKAVESIIAPTSAAIDYVRIIDPEFLNDLSTATQGCVIVVAVILDGVRLIDNHILL